VKTRVLVGLLMVGMAGVAVADDGSALFMSKCRSCHGPEGKGNPALKKIYGPNINLTTDATQLRDDAELRKIIRHGAVKGKMPEFNKELSQEQITALISHIRSVKTPAGTPGPDLNAE